MNKDATSKVDSSTNTLEEEKLRLEFARLRYERQKLALEIRLKRKEIEHRPKQSLKEALSNPLVLAIVGGSLTLLTSIVTGYLTSSANREADNRRAENTRSSEMQTLQSELIKTFLKTADSKTARDNLMFLIEAGLIPDHEPRIRKYLDNNTKTIPKISDAMTAVSYPPCPVIDLPGSASTTGPTAVSIHLGTNRVNPNAYGGWDGQMKGAVADANSMQKLASALGYHSNVLIDASARADCFLPTLYALAQKLDSSDTLLITVAGHGGQLPDLEGNEPDGQVETWVLYDREVLTTELYKAFLLFKTGVTIILVQDTSHAPDFRRNTSTTELRANLIVIGGSHQNQFASDGKDHGAFTEALLRTWNNGEFSGNYRTFVDSIGKKMTGSQSPHISVYGPDSALLSRRPFVLSP